ncbi:hypothetical protein SPRG_07225 [Saprolegnia parasitica CBS 223.65]|uniref:Condensin II complex subunit H2 N-terminal domain-containing protein n=1 Tax=Saprolegnia parasitica (strain CBS 223.65) TaxID=695850 RepID=A0A067CAZ5_SAPPC|nr:hypothetical protein SPRG_07225 [Saprolegnia parasitica CBS 223.65]KDO27949.1 hypothetical protein SPRG_07225 [Saprolegnia parasitica CBS 223.65]|eukprot:XP_012201401.1 hypothetical protein SPRG_07225 [Saprolegnia parasitica CBS 223.65]
MAASASATGHLLEPIRDLGWQLDLAAELEEYLQAIQADESDLVNFAQAALLVQNSTVRYSKKVENLYTLVLDALTQFQSHPEKERTTKRQRTAHGSASRGTASDGTVLATSDFESHGSSLDAPVHWVFHKRVEESDKIDLLPNTQLLHASSKRITTKTFQASMALMGSLVPDEVVTGESFKLRSCAVHSKSGALLLDDCSKLLLDPDAAVPTVELPVEAANVTFRRQTLLGNISEGDEGAPDDAAVVDESMTEHNVPDNDVDDYGMDYDFGGGYESPMKDVASSSVPTTPPPQATDFTAKTNESPLKSKPDPWLQLDPYDASQSVSQPFTKGVTYTTPKLKTTKSAVAKDEPLYDPNAKRAQRSAERLKRHLAAKPALLFTSFDFENVPFRQLHLQYSNAIVRTDAAATAPKAEPLFVPADETPTAPMLEANDGDVAVDEYGFDAGVSDYEDDDGGVLYSPAPPPVKSDIMSTKEEKAFKPEDDAPSYEDLCKQHIEQFLHGSEHYKKQTTLTRKVAKWQASLAPLLTAQEARPPFDIQACGKSIVEHLEPTAPRAFGAVVEGLSVYEVCRMFTATLQLVRASLFRV